MKKNLLRNGMLMIGLLPFILALITGLYAAFTGFNGLSLKGAPTYGIQAFWDWLVLYSYVFWPSYLLGVLLIAAVLIIQWKRK